jgi:hypothetical protein
MLSNVETHPDCKSEYLKTMMLFKESLFNLINSKDANQFHILRKYKIYENDDEDLNITMLTHVYEVKDGKVLYFKNSPNDCSYKDNTKSFNKTMHPVMYYHLGNRVSANYDLVKKYYDTDNFNDYMFISKSRLEGYDTKMISNRNTILIRANGNINTYRLNINLDSVIDKDDIINLVLLSKVTLERLYNQIESVFTQEVTLPA